MQIQKSNLLNHQFLKHLLLAGAFLVALSLGAHLDIDVGGEVSFTLQTLILGLAYFYLPLRWRLLFIGTYLCLGIAGFPVFNGGVGWSYVKSWPLGFFIGFIFSSFLPKPKSQKFLAVLWYFVTLHLIIFFVGIVGVGIYFNSTYKMFETASTLWIGALVKSMLGAFVVLCLNAISKPNLLAEH